MAVNTTGTTKLRHLATFRTTGIFTVPKGVTKIWVTVNGASGGAGGYNPPPNYFGGAGGAAKIIGAWVNVVPGGTYPVIIGAAGSAGVNGGNAGGTGGTTYFDGSLVVNGGNGGAYGGAAGNVGNTAAETNLPVLYPTGAETRVSGFVESNTTVPGGAGPAWNTNSPGPGIQGIVQIFGV